MKTSYIVQMACLSGTFLLLTTSSGYALFPTFDVSKVQSAIQSYTEEVQGVQAKIMSSKAVTETYQAIGDGVGTITKYAKDAQELKKEAEEKIETAQRYQKRIETLKSKYATMASNALDTATGLADQAKSAAGGAVVTFEGVTGSSSSTTTSASNTAAAEETPSEDFSLDTSWNGEDNGGEFEDTENADAENGDTASGEAEPTRQIFKRATASLSNTASLVADVQPAADRLVDSSLKETAATVATQPTLNVSTDTVAAAVATQPALTAVSDKTIVKTKALSTLKASDAVSAVETTLTPQATSSAITTDIQAGTAAVKTTRQPFSGAVKKTILQNKELQSTDLEANSLTTSSLDPVDTFSVVWSVPMSFAQESSASVKTGTAPGDRFVFSDQIAYECQIGWSGSESETVTFTTDTIKKCLNIWVTGMNDKTQSTKASWVNKYQEALNDQTAEDLATAIVNKTYSATFKQVIAPDSKTKTEAVSTERDGVSAYMMIAAQNQEVILRLMEALAARTITESWKNVRDMQADYLDELQGEN